MNSQERVWAVLNRQPVDRVPIHIITLDGKICDEILGKPPRTAFDAIDDIENQYPEDWIERVNGILTNIEISVFSQSQEDLC